MNPLELLLLSQCDITVEDYLRICDPVRYALNKPELVVKLFLRTPLAPEAKIFLLSGAKTLEGAYNIMTTP